MSDENGVNLTSATLPELSAEIAVPAYDRSRLHPSIVHIGVGGFHRSHLATYVHELCGHGYTDWSIVGAGMLDADRVMAEALDAQDHLYTLISRGPEHTDVEVIGSIVDYVLAAGAPAELITRIADPAVQIVSLTVTEGGYPIDDTTGAYAADSPAGGAGSTFATIAAGLDARRRTCGAPITIMSCDNIMANGAATRSATLGEAAALDGELERWIAASVSFPNSMVDRITPATTDADRRWLASRHGLIDRWPVVAEPFRQWVIEDSFNGNRPPLDDLDVIVTNDVEPYELMKLRLLNAGHSCLAYLAALDRIETVDAAMADPAINQFLVAFFEYEAKPVLPPVAGVDLDDYTASLIARFSNPEIGDQISRLCLDGSAKFPKFLLPTIRAQRDAGGPLALSALALAGWCEYLNGTTHDGAAITLSADPMLDAAVDHARRSRHDPRAFLGFSEVFGPDLGEPGPFSDAFVAALGLIRSQGIGSAIETAVRGVEGNSVGSRG